MRKSGHDGSQHAKISLGSDPAAVDPTAMVETVLPFVADHEIMRSIAMMVVIGNPTIAEGPLDESVEVPELQG